MKVIVGIFGNKMWGQAAGKTTSGCRAGVITFRVIIAGREWLRSFGRFRWRVRSLRMTEKKKALPPDDRKGCHCYESNCFVVILKMAGLHLSWCG
ncbi:MAG: hypothetical protein WAO23_04865 [Dethiobacteria bacterium]